MIYGARGKKTVKIEALLIILMSVSSLSFGQCVNRYVNGASVTECHDKTDDTAANATAISTAIGLDYFLIIRPQMEAEKRLKQNAIEGQYQPDYELADAIMANNIPQAQSVNMHEPLIRGHRLGETWDEFLSATPVLARHVRECRFKPGKTDPRHYNPCTALNEAGAGDITFDCVASSEVGKDVYCRDFNGEVGFRNGVLYSYKVIINASWDDVLPDLVQKFGPVQATDKDKTVGMWASKNYYAIAAETENGVVVSLVTPTRYREILKDKEIAKKQENNENMQHVNALN